MKKSSRTLLRRSSAAPVSSVSSRNDAVITRLVGAVLLDQHEHWQLEGRRVVSAESMAAIPELGDSLALRGLSA